MESVATSFFHAVQAVHNRMALGAKSIFPSLPETAQLGIFRFSHTVPLSICYSFTVLDSRRIRSHHKQVVLQEMHRILQTVISFLGS